MSAGIIYIQPAVHSKLYENCASVCYNIIKKSSICFNIHFIMFDTVYSIPSFVLLVHAEMPFTYKIDNKIVLTHNKKCSYTFNIMCI